MIETWENEGGAVVAGDPMYGPNKAYERTDMYGQEKFMYKTPHGHTMSFDVVDPQTKQIEDGLADLQRQVTDMNVCVSTVERNCREAEVIVGKLSEICKAL